MKRICAAIVSALLLAGIYSAIQYVPVSRQEPDIYHFSYGELFVITLLYGGPVFFLIGIPVSLLIDYAVGKNMPSSARRVYVQKLLCYFAAGLLAGAAVISFLMPVSHSWTFLLSYGLLGAGAAVLYFHLLLLLKWAGKRKQRQKAGQTAGKRLFLVKTTIRGHVYFHRGN